jgi:hypothetical protein
LVFAVQSQLRIEPFDGGDVGLQLSRQFVGVAQRELARLTFLLVEHALGFGKLAAQKFGRVRCLARSAAGVLLDVESGQRVRDFGDTLGVAAGVTHREGNRRAASRRLLDAFELQLDIAPHPFDNDFDRHDISQLRVQPQRVIRSARRARLVTRW